MHLTRTELVTMNKNLRTEIYALRAENAALHARRYAPSARGPPWQRKDR
jgi:hypothetical protein